MLPRNLTDEEMRPIFEAYGEIEELYIMRSHDGKSKGKRVKQIESRWLGFRVWYWLNNEMDGNVRYVDE